MSDALARRRLIREAIVCLSPTAYQSLGVYFVRLLRKAELIDWMALNQDGSPSQGHPDGRIRLRSGDFIDVEVSTAADWDAKIRSDIVAIANRNSELLQKTVEIIFVTAHDVDLRTQAKNVAREQALREYGSALLGISESRISFIHRSALIEELAQPRYAQLVANMLGVDTDPAPFRTVTDHISLSFGARGNAWQWPIDRESFFEGSIQFPAPIMDHAMRQLITHRRLLVTGHGATGKTTLALSIGLQFERTATVALYLDFLKSNAAHIHDLLRVLTAHACVDALVVLDNVQALRADELDDLLRELDARQEQGSLPLFNILLLARSLDGMDRRPVLATVARINLRVDSDALRCVFDLFARKRFDTSYPELPEAVRDKWCGDPSLYGRDLLLFSVALISNKQHLRLGPGNWDAIYTYLRRECLETYDHTQQAALLKLAALSQFGVPASVNAIASDHDVMARSGTAGSPSLLERGIVRQVAPGQFMVVHPSFATLLLGTVPGSRWTSLATTLFECIKRTPPLAPSLFGAIRREIQQFGRSDSVSQAAADVSALRDVVSRLAAAIRSDRILLLDLLFAAPPSAWGLLLDFLAESGTTPRHREWATVIKEAFDENCQQRRRAWLRNARFEQVLALLRWLPESHRNSLLKELLVFDADLVEQSVRSGAASTTAMLSYLTTLGLAEAVVPQEGLYRAVATDAFARQAASETITALPLLRHLGRVDEAKGMVAWRKIVSLLASLAPNDWRPREDVSTLGLAQLHSYFVTFKDNDSKLIVRHIQAAMAEISAQAAADLTQRPLTTVVQHLLALDEAAPGVGVDIRRRLSRRDLSNAIDPTAIENAAVLLRYFDAFVNVEEWGARIATGIRENICATDLLDGTISLGGLCAVVEYFGRSPTTLERTIVTRLIGCLLATDLSDICEQTQLQQLAKAISLLSSDAYNLPAQLLALRILNSLTVAELARRRRSALRSEFVGMLKLLISVRGPLATWAEAEFVLRVRRMLLERGVIDELAKPLRDLFAGSQRGIDNRVLTTVTTIRLFDEETGERLLDAWLTDDIIERIAKLLEEGSVRDVGAVFRCLSGNRPAVVRQLLTSPRFRAEHLTQRISDDDVAALAHILAGVRAHRPDIGILLCHAVAEKLNLDRFYRTHDTPVILRFLTNAWFLLGNSADLDRLYHGRILRTAQALAHRWRFQPDRPNSLSVFLGLLGVLARFSTVRLDVANAPIDLPTVAECDFLFAGADSDNRLITSVWGMKQLHLRISKSTATTCLRRVQARRRAIACTTERLAGAFDEVEQWLLSCKAAPR